MRTLSFLLLMALLASFLALPTDVAHAINTPWLSVSGRFIKDPAGNNVVLRGVSLVDIGEVNLGRTRNVSQVINMATNEADGWYARVVRLPVYPNAIDSSPGWLANPDAYFNNHLNPAIQNCVARQIYCIIDWHYIADYNNSTIDTNTRAFWNYVAPRYANTPNVIFELYNEPVNPDNWSTWKQWAQPWVDIIRSHAPNNLILIGGPRWSQNLSSAASSPFTGSNLVYVAHIYPEHGGQSNWDSWFGNAANSVPFFVTEWGWIQGGATPTNGTQSGYGVPFSNYLESKGLSWTAWVFDQYWDPKMWDENWNLLGGENYMGQFTKDFLFQHRNDNLPGGGAQRDRQDADQQAHDLACPVAVAHRESLPAQLDPGRRYICIGLRQCLAGFFATVSGVLQCASIGCARCRFLLLGGVHLPLGNFEHSGFRSRIRGERVGETDRIDVGEDDKQGRGDERNGLGFSLVPAGCAVHRGVIVAFDQFAKFCNIDRVPLQRLEHSLDPVALGCARQFLYRLLEGGGAVSCIDQISYGTPDDFRIDIRWLSIPALAERLDNWMCEEGFYKTFPLREVSMQEFSQCCFKILAAHLEPG